MKKQIKNYAYSINISAIGFTNINKIKKHLIIKENIPFLSKKSIDYQKYDTVISIIMAYPKTCYQKENMKDNEVYFSSSSWGNDYHTILKEKLNNLANYINTNIQKIDYIVLVDNHPFDDRYIAYNAGLGFYGKNNLLINPKYGSYIFIGHLFTNLHLKSDSPPKQKCLNCNLCLKACPTGALSSEGYNYQKCLSYLTQKEELTKEEKNMLNNCIYGCDKCQEVCPYNQKNNNSIYFNPTGVEFINVFNYQKLSNKKFKEKYGHLSGSWKGKKIIERNIDIYKDKIN